MISRVFPCLAALGCVLLVSCSPYPENSPHRPTHRPIRKPAQVPQVTPPAVPTTQPAAPDKSPDPVGARPRPPVASQAATLPPTRPAPPPTKEKPPTKENLPAAASSEWPVAHPAPGKAGYVLSPYNQKLILVRGIPSGTQVRDPASPDSNKKYFRVP